MASSFLIHINNITVMAPCFVTFLHYFQLLAKQCWQSHFHPKHVHMRASPANISFNHITTTMSSYKHPALRQTVQLSEMHRRHDLDASPQCVRPIFVEMLNHGK